MTRRPLRRQKKVRHHSGGVVYTCTLFLLIPLESSLYTSSHECTEFRNVEIITDVNLAHFTKFTPRHFPHIYQSMQQSSATQSLHLSFWGLRMIVACPHSSLQCLLVSTVFGTVSSLHPTSFLMIFILVYIEMSSEEREKKRRKEKKKLEKEKKMKEREIRRKKKEKEEQEEKERERDLRRKGVETKAFTPKEEADLGEMSDAGSIDSIDSQHDYLETHHVDNPMIRLALSACAEIEGGVLNH